MTLGSEQPSAMIRDTGATVAMQREVIDRWIGKRSFFTTFILSLAAIVELAEAPQEVVDALRMLTALVVAFYVVLSDATVRLLCAGQGRVQLTERHLQTLVLVFTVLWAAPSLKSLLTRHPEWWSSEGGDVPPA